VTELTAGAPLLALFEKWPAALSTPFNPAREVLSLIGSSRGWPAWNGCVLGIFHITHPAEASHQSCRHRVGHTTVSTHSRAVILSAAWISRSEVHAESKSLP
jgi:hypothetical protein